MPLRTLFAALIAAAAMLLPATADQTGIAVRPLKQTPSSFWSQTDRVIVYLRARAAEPMSLGEAQTYSAIAGVWLDPMRMMSDGGHVMQLTEPVPLAEAERIVRNLRNSPAVRHAEPDRRKRALQATSERFDLQWNLREPTAGINVETAWGNVTESTSIRIAVVDTGILAGHPDLPSNRLLDGYDFVSGDSNSTTFSTANDGNGRDENEADPGNWVSQSDLGNPIFSGCPVEDSDWHGTHITGIIAAETNGLGIRGINRNARVLPVRALGKCGGYTSDVVDAMRWAAGITIGSIRANATPVQVINLSLGGEGPCSPAEQNAIDEVLAAGVRAIVVASGNEGADASSSSPGNCKNVITVAGIDRNGSLAAYSNRGAGVFISAPGGYFVVGGDPRDGILSLFNNGKTTPQAFPTAFDYAYVQGTSEAAAHVSGVVSLMLSKNPNLTAAQVRAVLRTSARAFPNSSCNTCACGAGIVDAGVAVAQSTSPPADPGSSCSGGSGSSASVGGGGGGGGGCTIGRDGTADGALVALLIAAALVRLRRRAARSR